MFQLVKTPRPVVPQQPREQTDSVQILVAGGVANARKQTRIGEGTLERVVFPSRGVRNLRQVEDDVWEFRPGRPAS